MDGDGDVDSGGDVDSDGDGDVYADVDADVDAYYLDADLGADDLRLLLLDCFTRVCNLCMQEFLLGGQL